MSRYPVRILSSIVDALAPDGSEVRLLAAAEGGSMAHFRLNEGQVSRAARHRTVTELWYVTAGRGRIWRSGADGEEIAELHPGVSVVIAPGVAFQFRCDGSDPLEIVDVTMPPWPGDEEAELVPGAWEPRV